jgi:RHS repeat-associated protein
MLVTDRSFSIESYRYGFNGMEKDDNIVGTGNHYTTKERGYDSRLGRWWSIDPESGIFPGWTPYRAFLNNPNFFTDKSGSIEWPLKGTYVIQKNQSNFLKNQQVYSRRNGWIVQSGNFESPLTTTEYKTFISNPDKNAIIRTSQWNILRKSTPQQPMTSPHIGSDFRASVGTQVYSLGDGNITAINKSSGILSVQYGNGDEITFRHLNSISNDLKIGSKVYEGQGIAKTGNKYTTLPHLHIEGKDLNGNPINFEKNKYGKTTNKQFFDEFDGDYKKLPGYVKDHRKKSPAIDSSLKGK